MYVPWSEYMWARIGFDDEYTQARSFLYFQIHTNFFETVLPGDTEPLRKWETEIQRYERGVREGKDYSGIEQFNKWAPQLYHIYQEEHKTRPIPTDDELLGPYPKDAHIFTVAELEHMTHRNHRDEDFAPPASATDDEERRAFKEQSRQAVFSPHLREEIADLVNELVLSFLDRILPCLKLEDRRACLPELLPRYKVDKTVDQSIAKAFFWGPDANLPYFEAPLVKVKAFVGDFVPGVPCPESVATGLLHGAVYLVEDIVFSSDWMAIGRHDAPREEGKPPVIVPWSIRNHIYGDWALGQHLFHSRVLWKGRPDDE